ncbi:FRG domain-containing protein [Haloarcula sp. JP-L23]|uniref:FRG domain-containing protein n=1 Tax=Haloarcula sp. JP-L23 TaxID=2716717 RepID=UPI00140F4BBF|nr:FRG domain-containing protein [Haloarcula sp. JP-L23]
MSRQRKSSERNRPEGPETAGHSEKNPSRPDEKPDRSERTTTTHRETAEGPITEYRAETWEDLQTLLFEDAWRPDIGRVRSPYVFRGQSNAAYGLETSLQRFLGGSERWDLEWHLLKSFNHYARDELQQVPFGAEFKAIAQHHGLPTRLLDWTYSPYVAAYFATRGRQDVDGLIWAVDYRTIHEHAPDEFRELFDDADLSVFDASGIDDVAVSLLREMGVDFGVIRNGGTTHILKYTQLWEQMAAAYPDDFVVFYEAPAIDDRIINQSALFSTTGNPSTRIDEWLAEMAAEAVRRIIVPAERKAEFRDRLVQANITAKTLFPGLDGVAAWLCEYFRPPAKADGTAASIPIPEAARSPGRGDLRSGS